MTVGVRLLSRPPCTHDDCGNRAVIELLYDGPTQRHGPPALCALHAQDLAYNLASALSDDELERHATHIENLKHNRKVAKDKNR